MSRRTNMRTVNGTIIYIEEEEIKEAILSLLYKQKPDIRPLGLDHRQQDPTVEFTINKAGIEARVEIIDK